MIEIKHFRIFAITLLAIIAAFAATSAQAQYSLLYNFGSQSTDPANPTGSLTQGFDGTLYGTSSGGGTDAVGTVFKLTAAGQVKVLYSFCSLANCADGEQPAGLTLRPNGHFIGAAQVGGTGFGTIFDISPAGALTVLYTFTGGTDGREPSAPIYANGAFYGTAYSAGAPSGCGTIYRIVGPGAIQIMHRFNKTTGCYPTGLVLGTDGNFYGTTQEGGTFEDGVVFSMTPAGIVTVLHSFDPNSDGTEPVGTLIQANDGNFYGATKTSGFATFGPIIFKITSAGTFNIFYQLNGESDGDFVQAGLLQATDGNFYGVASQGGACDECGTLFRVTPGASFSVLNDFTLATGYNPAAAVTQHTDGVLYGNALYGGTGTVQACSQFDGCGILYSWNGSLPPFVSTVQLMGSVASSVEILGQGFTSSTTVSFNGVPASATVQSGTSLRATVPAGATTGFVTVTTSTGTLTSNRQFIVTP